jgi:hypothetical protein
MTKTSTLLLPTVALSLLAWGDSARIGYQQEKANIINENRRLRKTVEPVNLFSLSDVVFLRAAFLYSFESPREN